MSRTHHLLRLPFAAVGRSPQGPLIARADSVQRIPELSSNSGIGAVLQHAGAFTILDLPTNLGSELEVIALVVD